MNSDGKKVECETHFANIFMAGDVDHARIVCRRFCMDVGFCVTLTETDYVYTGGMESGFIVGCINYPRFPCSESELISKAESLAEKLLKELCQTSYTIQSKGKTMWRSYRE